MDIAILTSKKSLLWWAIILIIFILLAFVPLYAPGYPVVLLSSILMYVIMTVSWVMFSGPTGYMSLAPAAFFGVGIYTSAIIGKALPFPIVVGIGGLASFCLALLVGALTLRLRGIYFAIFTFGLVMLIAHSLLFWELHVTGTRGRFVMVMSYNNECDVFPLVELSKERHYRFSSFGIQVSSWFVSKNNLWVVNQSSRNGKTLLFSTR